MSYLIGSLALFLSAMVFDAPLLTSTFRHFVLHNRSLLGYRLLTESVKPVNGFKGHFFDGVIPKFKKY